MKRRRNLPLLILVAVSLLACGLYYATYFQAVAASWQWKSAQWFGLDQHFQQEHHSSSSHSLAIKAVQRELLVQQSTGNQTDGSQQLLLSTSLEATQEVFPAQEDASSDCHLPKLDPMDKSITSFIKPPMEVDCKESYPLLFRTDLRNTLIQVGDLLGPEYINVSCCYRAVRRRENFSDKEIEYSRECFPIKRRRQEIPHEHEFIYIRCKNESAGPGEDSGKNRTGGAKSVVLHRDMFAFVPLKPETELRVQVTSRSSRPGGKVEETTMENKDERLNVVILGLDAQSHMNFLRQMPLTAEYLLRNLSAISLDGYTKVSDNTFPNIVPLLTGLNVSEIRRACWGRKEVPFDECPFIWKDYGEHGYRTSFAEDSVWMGAFHYNKAGFLRQPTDYYLHPFTNLMAKKIGHHTSGNSELCYGPRLGFQVLLDYMVKTAVGLKGRRYFQFIWATSLFHDYLNSPRLGDELLLRTFTFLHDEGYLNRTAFLLLSDHGIRWGAIRTTYQGKIEERMPLAYLIFPQWFHQSHPTALDNLRLNAQRLTTPFDLHELLNDVLHQRWDVRENVISLQKRRGLSLFQPIPPSRSCEDAEIAPHWCVCNALENFPSNSPIVTQAAAYILGRINGMLSYLQDYCAPLELATVFHAMKTIHPSHFEGETAPIGGSAYVQDNLTIITPPSSRPSRRTEKITLQVTIVTKPGDAVFEATVTKEEKPATDDNSRGAGENIDEWQLAGEISRISLYGSQSSCISNFFLKKYCYCLDLTIPTSIPSATTATTRDIS